MIESWQPTPLLRWRAQPNSNGPHILEQRWFEYNTGRVEWRPVPIEVVLTRKEP